MLVCVHARCASHAPVQQRNLTGSCAGTACVAPLRAYLQILLLTLAVMSYLVYKNKHRAKEFLASFLNYEGLLVVEVRECERRDVSA